MYLCHPRFLFGFGFQNYDELISLIDEGDINKVNVEFTALAMNNSDPVYASLTDLERTCFSFGTRQTYQ